VVLSQPPRPRCCLFGTPGMCQTPTHHVLRITILLLDQQPDPRSCTSTLTANEPQITPHSLTLQYTAQRTAKCFVASQTMPIAPGFTACARA
jgi:hypothetical protein